MLGSPRAPHDATSYFAAAARSLPLVASAVGALMVTTIGDPRNSWARPLILAVPTTVRDTSLPAGALSVATILNPASEAPRLMLVELRVRPSGAPSTLRVISSVNHPRRLALTENSASLAADFLSGASAITASRGKELASVNGIGSMVSGIARLYSATFWPFTLASALNSTNRVPVSESVFALNLIVARVSAPLSVTGSTSMFLASG